jgi:hypothetical protein
MFIFSQWWHKGINIIPRTVMKTLYVMTVLIQIVLAL